MNLEAWHGSIGAIIEELEGADVPRRLMGALACLVPFELAAVFLNRGRSRPLILYDNFELVGAERGIAAYAENTYVLNPFYQACQRGLEDGVYRIRDLAPDAYFESEYYRTHRIHRRDTEEIGYLTENWPEGLEELDIAVTLSPGVRSEISLYRTLENRGFAERELALLSAVLPVLRALLKRHWIGLQAEKQRVSPPDNRIDQAFEDFGSAVLTERERDVAQLILRGHSSESIGFNLGITLGTVKTHRKNTYAKLGISSQSELLSLFLKQLQSL